MEKTSLMTSKRHISRKPALGALAHDARAVSQSHSPISSNDEEHSDSGEPEPIVSSVSRYRSTRHLANPNHNGTGTEQISANTQIRTNFSEVSDNIDPARDKSSDLVQEKLRPRNFWQHVHTTVGKFWLWEIAACVLSLACLASVVGVLIYEDGRQLDQWGWAIPPTAVISFIGTLAKSAIVLVISQILSQLKWLHFRDIKSLEHIKTFDDASRGPIGSMMVIWRSRRWLASIGACLTIMTLLMDPFVQLVFSFPTDLVEDKSQQATFNTSSHYSDESTKTYAAYWTSVNQGFLSSSLTQAVVCPSGNCTWDNPIKTLGVCGSCSDVTSTVKVNCTSSNDSGELYTAICTYKFLSGSVLTAIGLSDVSIGHVPVGPMTELTLWNSSGSYGLGKMNISLPLDVDPEMANPLIGSNFNASIFDGTMVIFDAIQLVYPEDNDETNIPPAQCSTCEIYWCQRTYDGLKVTNSEPITMTDIAKERLWYVSNDETRIQFNAYGQLNYFFLPDKVDALRKEGSSTSRFQYSAYDTMSRYLASFFDAYYIDSNVGEGGLKIAFNYSFGTTDLMDFPVTIDSLVTSKDINATINKLADSLTELIRTGNNSTSVVGQTLVVKSFIHVRWGWLALPLTVMTVTCVLLIIVAIKSHLQRMPIWKDNPLALLFHRINGVHFLPEVDSRSGASDLQNMAKEIWIKLDENTPLTFIASSKKIKHDPRWWRKG